MDAKTMRAALAAAVRVTISTSLIGCGGQATSDSGGPTTPSQESDDQRTPAPVNERPRYVVSSGGSSMGGASTGGSSMLGGAGATATNEAGSAGSPELSGCEAIDACMKSLAGLDFGDPLPDAAAERCCATIIQGLSRPSADGQPLACGPELSSDFFALPAHQACCTSVAGAWGDPACSPWGPPVPPALPEGALLSWRAVA